VRARTALSNRPGGASTHTASEESRRMLASGLKYELKEEDWLN
jgi:hypothetical protein